MTIGERIKTFRKAKGLSQIDLAQQAEIAVNSIRLYEAGKREPKLEAIEKLSVALGVTKGQLLGWSREPDAMDEAVLSLYPDYDPTKETVSEYLERKEKDPEPSQPAKPEVSEDDIKFALFGGAGEITDEMYDEVKEFVKFVKMKHGQ
ncbi:MAG: helix-turn-helix transcriptional regulator [Oscillospiraceae bacterium]|nr:helix-turn-helix transcriptional regulator [Oscillospiraceae bacterium]